MLLLGEEFLIDLNLQVDGDDHVVEHSGIFGMVIATMTLQLTAFAISGAHDLLVHKSGTPDVHTTTDVQAIVPAPEIVDLVGHHLSTGLNGDRLRSVVKGSSGKCGLVVVNSAIIRPLRDEHFAGKSFMLSSLFFLQELIRPRAMLKMRTLRRTHRAGLISHIVDFLGIVTVVCLEDRIPGRLGRRPGGISAWVALGQQDDTNPKEES